jgi:Kef-type K+ transport system membrane component KefB
MTEFFSTAGSQDHAWILFILIVLFSSTFGKNWLFSKLEIPIITGYMIMGFIFGPYAFGVMSIKQTHELGYVNQAALAFIATSAGAEIYLPEIMPLIKPIAWISTLAITFTLVIGTAFAYGVGGTPLLPWLVGYNSCNLGIAMLIATIMTSLSPTSVLAVVRASGPITHIMIGITVAADVVVLTIFAIVQTMTQNLCSGKEFDVATFFVNLLLILVWGWLLGHLIVRLLYFKRLKHLILPICFLNYLICEYILAVSAASGDFEINIDALLICISAGPACFMKHDYKLAFLRVLRCPAHLQASNTVFGEAGMRS